MSGFVLAGGLWSIKTTNFKQKVAFAHVQRAWVATKFIALDIFVRCWPGLAPAGGLLFFASPKKPNEKKGDPQSGSLRCASGNLRCSTPAGVRRTRFAQTTAALIPLTSALLSPARTGQSGMGPDSGSSTRFTGTAVLPLLPLVEGWDEGSPILNSPQSPSVFAGERKQKRIRARACLSEASLHVTPLLLSATGCPQRSAGRHE